MPSIQKIGGFLQGLAGGIQSAQKQALDRQLLQVRKDEQENRSRMLQADLDKTRQQIDIAQQQSVIMQSGQIRQNLQFELDGISSDVAKAESARQLIIDSGAINRKPEVDALTAMIAGLNTQATDKQSVANDMIGGLMATSQSAESAKSGARGEAMDTLSLPPSGGETFERPSLSLPGDQPQQQAAPQAAEQEPMQVDQEPVQQAQQEIPNGFGVTRSQILANLGGRDAEVSQNPDGTFTVIVEDPLIETGSSTEQTMTADEEAGDDPDSGSFDMRRTQKSRQTGERNSEAVKEEFEKALVAAGFRNEDGVLLGMNVVTRSQHNAAAEGGAVEAIDDVAPILESNITQLSGVGETSGDTAIFIDPEKGFQLRPEMMTNLVESVEVGASIVNTLDEMSERETLSQGAIDSLAGVAGETLQMIKNKGVEGGLLKADGDNLVWNPFHPEAADTLNTYFNLSQLVSNQASENFQGSEGMVLRNMRPTDFPEMFLEASTQTGHLGLPSGTVKRKSRTVAENYHRLLQTLDSNLDGDYDKISDQQRKTLIDRINRDVKFFDKGTVRDVVQETADQILGKLLLAGDEIGLIGGGR